MKTSVIRIGNSRGIRIPKPLIEEIGLDGDVDITIKGKSLVISKIDKPRAGWSERFAEMRQNGDDTLLDPDILTSSWDEKEWEWK